jgi:hypothetical protein
VDDAAHDAVAAEVRQLEHGGRPERAAWVARRWLAQDPSDARRWVLFAETVPSGARPLFEEALRLDRGSAAAWTGLAREDLAAGDVPGATAALRAAVAADPGAADPHLLLAELEGDVPAALAWWMAGPRAAERALLVARLEPALADSVLAGAPGAEAAAARAARALGRGDVGAARLELPAAPPATGDRLAGWARCLEAGTATAEAFAQFEALRAEALVHPASPPDRATEMDWLRFWWDFLSEESATVNFDDCVVVYAVAVLGTYGSPPVGPWDPTPDGTTPNQDRPYVHMEEAADYWGLATEWANHVDNGVDR